METTNTKSPKLNRIIYWVSTLWLALGMVSTGVVQLMNNPEETELFARLGYPSYLPSFLGAAKFLGVIAILIPRFRRLKEWAYAGFCFMMVGAIYSHIVTRDPASELFGPTLLLVLTFVSWHFRPVDRKIG